MGTTLRYSHPRALLVRVLDEIARMARHYSE